MATFFVEDIPTWMFGFVIRENHHLVMDRDSVVRLMDLTLRQTPEFSSTALFSPYFGKLISTVYGVQINLTEPEAQLMNELFLCWLRSDVSKAGWDMPHGIWDHFKGGVYESDRVDRDADTGNPRVSYRSLIHGSTHSRRAEQWNEVVKWPDGQWRSRFMFRGPPGTPEPIWKVPSPHDF